MLKPYIFLYGPSGSGKTRIGRILARNLNLSFIDLDERIESGSLLSIPEIFSEELESGFRVRETEALRDSLAGGAKVLALGGGALTTTENREIVEETGQVIVLRAPYETLISRINQDETERPLLTGDSAKKLRNLLDQRKSHYLSFPTQVDTHEKDPDEVAWEIQVISGRFYLRGMESEKTPGYDVRIQGNQLDLLGNIMKDQRLLGPIAVVSDEVVGQIYLSRVLTSLEKAGYAAESISIPAGENYKTLKTVSNLWDMFISSNIERSSTIVALGGGVIGDLSGFAAATFNRGVPWVVVPTSLLAMVDASIGGKTGADLPEGKNLIGSFYPPRLVLTDPDVLNTLPEVEFNNGLAEVVKHGFIGDSKLISSCNEEIYGNPRVNLSEIVRRAMAVKIKFIEEDPYERGSRAALNFGHTVGHGIELASSFQIRHGEAVAIGMVTETILAERIGLADKGLADEIANTLRIQKLPVSIPAGIDSESAVNAIRMDKKKSGGKIRFALPADIGDIRIGVEVKEWERIIWES